jgi:hypothetical protein
MAAPELVNEDVTLGSEAIDVLSKDKALKPSAYLWLFNEPTNEWLFVVITDEVTRHGPRSAYKRIDGALRKAKLSNRLPLSRVVAMSPKDRIFETVLKFIKARFPAQHVDPRRKNTMLQNCDIGEGFGVTNVFIYKMP